MQHEGQIFYAERRKHHYVLCRAFVRHAQDKQGLLFRDWLENEAKNTASVQQPEITEALKWASINCGKTNLSLTDEEYELIRAEYRERLKKVFDSWKIKKPRPKPADKIKFVRELNKNTYNIHHWSEKNGGLLLLAEETDTEIYRLIQTAKEPEYVDYEPEKDLIAFFRLNPDLELQEPKYFTFELLEKKGFTRLAGWIRKKHGSIENFVRALPEDNMELKRIRERFRLVDRYPETEARDRR